MKCTFLFQSLLVLCLSCNNSSKTHTEVPVPESIAIFEIYLKDAAAVDHFSDLLRDTLKLPVEWEPFDIFGNDVVYDAAFHLGNTTLELLSVNPPDSTIQADAIYNRILFESANIDSTALAIKKMSAGQGTPFNFNITSNNASLMIGRQINLDTLSSLSNINIAFWQYLNSGYNFPERTIKGETIDALRPKLAKALNSNPMGIIGLKEVHLSIKQTAIDHWQLLLGPSESNKWVLAKEPIISCTASKNNLGVDWITLRVRNLEDAKKFLSQKDLLAIEENKVFIAPSKIYGLKIYLEE